MLVDFQSRPLSPTQEIGVATAATLAIVSAVAFIILANLRLSPNLKQALVLSATSINIISTSIVSVALLALSLKREKKEEKIAQEPIVVILPPEDDDLSLAPLDGPASVGLANPIENVHDLHQHFMDSCCAGLKKAEAFIRVLEKSGKPVTTSVIQKYFPIVEIKETPLYKILKSTTSTRAMQDGLAEGVSREVRHFFYVHGKKWEEEKFFAKNRPEDPDTKKHPDDNLTHFYDCHLFDGENYSTILKEALQQTETLHYPYLTMLKQELKPQEIQTEAALKATAEELKLKLNPDHYKIFLQESQFQFNNILGLCCYVPGYVVMRQGFFMSYPGYDLGYRTQDILRFHEKPTMWSPLIAKESAIHKQVPERVEAIAGIQILGRAPLFAGSNIDKALQQIIKSVYLPILQVVKGEATGPNAFESSAYNVIKVDPGYGEKLTLHFKEKKGGAYVPKEKFKDLLNDPFAPLSELNPIEEVEALTKYLSDN
jgi:hypothetical protein